MGGSREANLEFKWGSKRGVGQNGAVQFYESFTYDGVDYSLYDCVYMWNEPEVDIGKLVKIWEMPNRKKVVKVVWFFRPTEILRWLGDDAPLQNEIFLASGEGKGISNLNPLEVLCGKCNILCTSKDKRNPQASEVELGMADYIFYRTFDVGTCTITDNFPNAIAGIEVGYFFNRREDQKLISLSNIQANLVERSRKPTSLAKVELALAVGNGSKESKKLASGLCEQEDISDESTMLRTETFTKDSACNQNEDIGQLVMSGDLSQKCPPDNRSLKKGKFIDSSGQSLKLHSIDSKLGNGPRSNFGKEFDTKFVFENKMVPKASVLETTDSVGQVTYNKRVETSSQFFDVTKRPDDIRRKWFKPLPWEENMQRAHEEGTLVLLENLDPSYTSSEVEDIVWQCFKEKVNGKMIQQNTFSCPHYGQALVIFKSKNAAESAIDQLRRRCLMLTDGRSVIGSQGVPRKTKKSLTFPGHMVIKEASFQKQREGMKKAVSTSHCAQPNTIEYDMALEWCLLQERSNIWWDSLHERQAKEIQFHKRKLMMHLIDKS